MIRCIDVSFASEWDRETGDMRWAFVIKQGDKTIATMHNLIRAGDVDSADFTLDASPTVAAYRAIGIALAFLSAHGQNKSQVRFYGKNVIAINVMNGRWKVKAGVQDYYSARSLADKFEDVHFTWVDPQDKSDAEQLLAAPTTEVK